MEQVIRHDGLLGDCRATQRRSVSLCYRFQELRYTLARLRGDLEAALRACDLRGSTSRRRRR